MIEVLPGEERGLESRWWALCKPIVLREDRADRDVGTSSRDDRARNWDGKCVEIGDRNQLERSTDEN
jgi:hypothetical protein